MKLPHFALVKATFYAAPYYQIDKGKIITINEVDEEQEATYQIFHNKTEKIVRNIAYLTFSVYGEEILCFAKFVFDQDEAFFKDVYPGFSKN